MGFRVLGLGFRVLGLGFWVEGLGFRVLGLGTLNPNLGHVGDLGGRWRAEKKLQGTILSRGLG